MLIKYEPYQKEALRFLLQKKHGALFIDPGLGKTAIILALLKLLLNMQKANRVLIIAPIRPIASVTAALAALKEMLVSCAILPLNAATTVADTIKNNQI